MILSGQERVSCAEAIRNPEFPAIFEEYLAEVSDLQNRKEQIEYLRELESKGELPSGKKLVWPEQWICLEARPLRQSCEMNFFVNIVLSDDESLRSGEEMDNDENIPFYVAAPKYGKNEESRCVDIDVLVSSRIVDKTKQHVNSHVASLARIFIENLNSTYFKTEKLSKDVKLRRGWKYRDNLSPDYIMPFVVNATGGDDEKKNPQSDNDHRRFVRPVDSPKILFKQACDEPKEGGMSLGNDKSGGASYKVIYLYSDREDVPKTASAIRVDVCLPGTVSSDEIVIDKECSDGFRVKTDIHSIHVNLKGLSSSQYENGKASFNKRKSNLSITFAL
jgi:hypothetical protein